MLQKVLVGHPGALYRVENAAYSSHGGVGLFCYIIRRVQFSPKGGGAGL